MAKFILTFVPDFESFCALDLKNGQEQIFRSIFANVFDCTFWEKINDAFVLPPVDNL